MANISLRAYYREIEELIGQGRIDEVIAHCRHILKFYPKDVAVYRLLAKAYLESQRFSDATDIFQRVLSVVPDDFVSHVGMSIIREDEGNQDAAIWHMERAFEVQPSNAAIRDELRRLFGKRDGMEPPKIRLTRGALARMYAQGDLYQQAIGELQAALAEEPGRFDLQVLLARMYYMNGMHVEAAEICNNLLAKLPFCLDANRFLASILSQSGRTQDAQTYLQRVQVLDPYAMHMSANYPAPEDVPDNMVPIIRLEWSPGQAVAEGESQPDWAASLGVNLQEDLAATSELPDWLAEEEPEAEEEFATLDEVDETPLEEQPLSASMEEPVEPPMQETTSPVEAAAEKPTSDVDDLVPDWMKDAGWATAESIFDEDGEEKTLPPTGVTGELVAADIPDWLQEMAPPEVKQEQETPAEPAIEEEEMSGEIPPWLGSRPPGPTDSVVMWLEQKKDDQEVPKTGPIEEGMAKPPDEEVPDWLKSVAEPVEQRPPAEAPVEEPAPEPATEQEGIDWSEPVAQAEVPDWLKTVDVEEPPPTEEDTRPSLTGQLRAEALREAEARRKAEGLTFEEQVAAETGEETPYETPPLVTPTVPAAAEPELESELPEWLKDAAPETPAKEAEPPAAVETPLAEEEMPEWLKEMEAVAPSVEVQVDESAGAAEASAAFEEVAPQAEEAFEPPAAEEEALPEAELPEWLKEAQAAPATPTPEPTSEEESAPEPSFLPSMEDQDAAIAWLESLAAKHGAAEEELITKPEERVETPPDWVRQSVSDDEALAASEGQGEEQAEAPALPEQPEWMMETLIADTLFPGEGEEEGGEAEEPSWTMETMQSKREEIWSPETGEAAPEAAEPEAAWRLETELPSGTPPADQETPTAEPAEEAWLPETGLPEEAAPEAPEAQETLEPEGEWMFATGFPEGEEVASPAQEVAAAEETPEWLRETALPEAAPGATPEEVTRAAEPSPEPAKTRDLGDEWMLETGFPQETAAEAEEAAAPTMEAAAAEETPEWVRDTGLPAEVTPEAEEAVAPTMEAAAAEETPEGAWETTLPETGTVETYAAEQAEPGAPVEEELPEPAPTRELGEEWTLETETARAQAEPVEAEPQVEALAEEVEEEPIESRPEWMLETLLPETAELVSPEPAETPVAETEVAEPPKPPVPPKPDTSLLYEGLLKQAKELLAKGDVAAAIDNYRRLVRRRRRLDEVIHDLHDATYRFPMDTQVLETLGDAYVKSDRLQDALDSYTKAEDLLRQ